MPLTYRALAMCGYKKSIPANPHSVKCGVSGRSGLFVFEVKGAAVNYLNYE